MMFHLLLFFFLHPCVKRTPQVSHATRSFFLFQLCGIGCDFKQMIVRLNSKVLQQLHQVVFYHFLRRVDLQYFFKLTLLNFHGKIVDIIDGTRTKSCYDNSIDREYFMESLSVRYFTHELVVSEIEQVCAANQ